MVTTLYNVLPNSWVFFGPWQGKGARPNREYEANLRFLGEGA